MKQYIQIQTYCICVCLLLLAGCTNEVQTTGENPEGEQAIELKIQVVNPVVSRAAIEVGTPEEDRITHCNFWLFEKNAAEDALPLLHKTSMYSGVTITKTELEKAGIPRDGYYKIYAIANLPEEQRELMNNPMQQSMQTLKSIAYTATERPSTAKSFCMTGSSIVRLVMVTANVGMVPVVRLPVKLAIQINDKHSSGITVTKLECLNDQQKVYMSAPEGSVDSAPFAESLNIPFKKKGADTLAVATTYINENLSSQPVELLITGTLDGKEKQWRAAITPDGSAVLLRNTACNITLNLLANSVSTSITIRPWDAGTKQEVSMDDLRITNCYIVPPGGQLFVPYTAALQARRMLWGDNMDAGQQITAEVIWADTRELADGVTVETKNELEVVDVNFPTGCQGNLVVGIKKAGESAYLWSWHLWVTDYDPWKESGRVVFEVEEGSENNFNKKRRWMDRNLGAMTNQYDEKGTARGLCYQWGRKDPFPGSTGWAENPQEPVLYTPGGGTTSVSVKNMNYQESFSDPLAFGNGFPMWCADLDSDIGNRTSHLGVLWSKDMIMKTLFDPCPYGWKSSDFSIPRASDFVYSNKGRQGEPYGYWSFTESRTIAGPQKAVAGNYWSTRVDYYISRLWFFDEAQAAPPAQRPPNHSDAHSMRCVISDIFF